MPSAPVCPDVKEYQRLASGRLPGPEKEALLDHLEECEFCGHKLEAIPDQDILPEYFRQAGTRADGLQEEAVARLVERLSKLRPEEAAPVEEASRGLACPGCQKVQASLAGGTATCPHCQAAQRVPTTGLARRPSATFRLPEEEDQIVVLPPGVSTPRTRGNDVLAPERFDFLTPPQAADEIGRLGPYRVLKLLGAGGMGVVFQAEDVQLGRLVALKVMRPALAASEAFRQRFLREARAGAALKSDHIVTIHQVGEERGVSFIAMELLEGMSLDRLLERGPTLPLAETLRVGREIATGLAVAHEKGLIHRDIKPNNLWLEGERRRVKILDFGLARFLAEDAQLTQPGAVVGTPAFLAPEQVAGETADARSDLFSLGCVLYRLCTDRPPFQGKDGLSTLIATAIETPVAPSELAPEVPPALSDLILRLLAKNPKERPATALAVVEALAAIEAGSLGGESLPARKVSLPERSKLLSPRRLLPGGASAALLLTASLALWQGWSGNPGDVRKEDRASGSVGAQTPSPAACQTTAPPGERTPCVLFVLASNDFYYPDYLPVRSKLTVAQVKVVVASSSAEPALPTRSQPGQPVTPDLALSQVKVKHYDAICFCGGTGVEEYAAAGPHAGLVRKLIEEALREDKYVAAIGSAPVILAEAGVLQDVPATCFRYGTPVGGYIQRLRQAGAVWTDQPVVVSGRIITGRGPADVHEFGNALLQAVTPGVRPSDTGEACHPSGADGTVPSRAPPGGTPSEK